MVDWYEVFERYSILTENGMSDKDAKNYILCKYGCKWLEKLARKENLVQALILENKSYTEIKNIIMSDGNV